MDRLLEARNEAPCAICGNSKDDHSGTSICCDTLEAIVRRCYQLSTIAPRPIVQARMAEEFPYTHPGLLCSVEKALATAGSASFFNGWFPVVDTQPTTASSPVFRTLTPTASFVTANESWSADESVAARMTTSLTSAELARLFCCEEPKESQQ